MVGDRMDTDVVAGLEAGLYTILVLTGVSTRASAERHTYRPSRIVDSVADLAASRRRGPSRTPARHGRRTPTPPSGDVRSRRGTSRVSGGA